MILAGGKGKRLNAKSLPKVIYPISGKPMISFLLDTLESIGLVKPVVVIGFQGEKVKKALGEKANYVYQRKRLGTAHAVLKAKQSLLGFESILILLGDMPFWRKETLKALIKLHKERSATLSLISVFFDNPSFFQYGRLVGDKDGKLLKIVEESEASEEEKRIKECNASCYLVKGDWLWHALSKIRKSGKGEYYLTDIIEIAVLKKQRIAVLSIKNWQEGIGINTKEQLKLAEDTWRERAGKKKILI